MRANKLLIVIFLAALLCYIPWSRKSDNDFASKDDLKGKVIITKDKIVPSHEIKIQDKANVKVFSNTIVSEVKSTSFVLSEKDHLYKTGKLISYDKNKVEEIFKNTIRESDSREKYIKRYKNNYSDFNEKIDILWVIDDSGSMKKIIEEITIKIDLFINQFIEKNIDFRMGGTTTSIDHRDFIISSTSLTENKKDFLDSFNELINIDTQGSGEEKGIEAILDYLKEIDALKSNNKLIVIIISDEDDSSLVYRQDGSEIYLPTQDAYRALKSILGDREFKLYSIVRFPPYQSAGIRYGALSKMTNGKVINLNDDFHQTLLNLGGEIIESILVEQISLDR